MRIKATYDDAKSEKRSIDRLLDEAGLGVGGDIQAFHTHNVMRRLVPLMPLSTGAFTKLMAAQTDVRRPWVVVQAPQALYLYHGVTMAGSPRAPTRTPLHYTRTKNPEAGPFWAQRLLQQQADAIVAELQAYIDKGGGRL